MKKFISFCILLVLIIILANCKQRNGSPAATPIKITNQEQTNINTEEAAPVFAQSFEYYAIDQEVEKRIKGVSWKQGSPVDISELSYIKVSYWGFDEKPHIGELIVNRSVAQEVVDIFKELYNARFPIDKVKLIDEYEANDNKSMSDNNTSAFCFREVEGKPGVISKHGYGMAIDINPVQNPYVNKDEVSPIEGKAYVNRDEVTKGMILKDDVCYKAFTSRGWTWGGDWKYEKDYQHFQKKVIKK